jgi:hypothetical protein
MEFAKWQVTTLGEVFFKKKSPLSCACFVALGKRLSLLSVMVLALGYLGTRQSLRNQYFFCFLLYNHSTYIRITDHNTSTDHSTYIGITTHI